MLDLPSNFLLIGQFIIPLTLLFNANLWAKERDFLTVLGPLYLVNKMDFQI